MSATKAQQSGWTVSASASSGAIKRAILDRAEQDRLEQISARRRSFASPRVVLAGAFVLIFGAIALVGFFGRAEVRAPSSSSSQAVGASLTDVQLNGDTESRGVDLETTTTTTTLAAAAAAVVETNLQEDLAEEQQTQPEEFVSEEEAPHEAEKVAQDDDGGSPSSESSSSSADDDSTSDGVEEEDNSEESKTEDGADPVSTSRRHLELASSDPSKISGGRAVKPPEARVPHCRGCSRVKVPEMCSTLAPRMSTPPEVQSQHGRRHLLASRRPRTRFQRADRALTGETRQQPFVPPAPRLRQRVVELMREFTSSTACGLWTAECVERYKKEGKEALGVAKGPEAVLKGKPLDESFFPSLAPGSLGSCAVVGAADTVLGKKRGEEIDDHDTVFRYNGPIKGYERDIGKKSDVMYWKVRNQEKQYGQEGQKARIVYMFKDQSKYYMFGNKNEFSQMTFRGMPILWESSFSSKVSEVYVEYAATNKRSVGSGRHAASGGFRLAMSILASGLCTRLDIYGYSAAGTGRYFKSAVVNTVHISGFEHFMFRTAMEEKLGICVYN
ncbi:glycosyltransferase family 29 protein [Pseudoscourfieldia marina]